MSAREVLDDADWLAQTTAVGAVRLEELQCPNRHNAVMTWRVVGGFKVSCEDCDESEQFDDREVLL